MTKVLKCLRNIVNPCGVDIRFLKTLYYLLRFCALADYFSWTSLASCFLKEKNDTEIPFIFNFLIFYVSITEIKESNTLKSKQKINRSNKLKDILLKWKKKV